MSILDWMRAAGFTDYEARAYLALVKHGEMTASRLSRASGVPYSKTYEVLSKLEGKGLVEVQKGRPMVFRAVPPRISLSRYGEEVLRGLEEEYSKKRRALEEDYAERTSRISEALRRASEELQVLFDEGGSLEASDDVIWTIRGRENVLTQMRELILGASKIKMILPKRFFRLLKDEIRGARAEGEVIVESSKDEAPEFLGRMKIYPMERIPFKCGVLIADGNRTIFTSEKLEMGFKSSNPGLATILNHFFEHEKEEAKMEQESSGL